MEYYHLYQGHWDKKLFAGLMQKTGFSKKQLNKWFWDRKKKEKDLEFTKRHTYPGLIFSI